MAYLSAPPYSDQGVAEWNGDGEAVGGIVVMRYGRNALDVINAVKDRIAQISKSLPDGVEIVPAYDRSGLIRGSIGTLVRDLLPDWERRARTQAILHDLGELGGDVAPLDPPVPDL